ncbi:hypothetical protein [Streptomyces albofaciens]|uniref:hypothetical protein n=1 Tax=Streptomyces albofaciens TaxID=66866 RepID=UPI001FCC3524|nr:hypothetical protein [Streptomyces albofaciens]
MPASASGRPGEHGRVFGADGCRHVVFVAGFPAVGAQEYEACRRIAVEAEGAVGVCLVRRAAREDVERGLAVVGGTAHARVMSALPSSHETAAAMVHRPAQQVLEEGIGLVRHARECDSRVAVDAGLVDAPRANPGLPGAAGRLTEAGAATVVLADAIGDGIAPSPPARRSSPPAPASPPIPRPCRAPPRTSSSPTWPAPAS